MTQSSFQIFVFRDTPASDSEWDRYLFQFPCLQLHLFLDCALFGAAAEPPRGLCAYSSPGKAIMQTDPTHLSLLYRSLGFTLASFRLSLLSVPSICDCHTEIFTQHSKQNRTEQNSKLAAFSWASSSSAAKTAPLTRCSSFI